MLAEHRSLVVAAVTQAVAAIESELSEVLLHGPGHHLGSSDENTRQHALLTPHAVALENESGPLKKWKKALKYMGKPLSLGAPVCQEGSLLVDLRNELTHYKSYWGGGLHRPGLLVALMRKGFALPPWVPRAGLVNDFPQRVLVAACAHWAHVTAAKFLDHVGDALGFGSSIVDHYRTGDYAVLLPPR
jgi:hypothetical protein